MRCPKCNQELNPHSERCPNCGTSARLAVPDGDTMTRVRRQISVMRRETEVSDIDLSDTSFSPVLKFDRPEEKVPDKPIENNPANNFPDESYDLVDLTGMIDSEIDGENRHRDLSASIRHLVNNKEDDLLAEYYFKDGISDLERYQLAQSYQKVEKESVDGSSDAGSGREENAASVGGTDATETDGEELSEAAKRLSEFPEETGIDKFLTSMWEKYDNAVFKTKSFFRRNITDRVSLYYGKFDRKTAGFMNGLLDRVYHRRFGSLKRKRSDDDGEGYRLRRRAWGIVFFAAILLLAGLAVVNIMMSSDINGQWIVSTDSGGNPNIIMEFKRGGRAVISVKSDDGWHVHKQGRYSTTRKNGHDMLTIVYEDGDVKRLYYIIEGKSGTFINVDTNVQVEYQLK